MNAESLLFAAACGAGVSLLVNVAVGYMCWRVERSARNVACVLEELRKDFSERATERDADLRNWASAEFAAKSPC